MQTTGMGIPSTLRQFAGSVHKNQQLSLNQPWFKDTRYSGWKITYLIVFVAGLRRVKPSNHLEQVVRRVPLRNQGYF